MNIKSQICWGTALSSAFLLSACSHQHVKPVVPPVVVSQPPKLPVPPVVPPPVLVKPPKIAEMIPAPAPYRDVVIAPVPLQPVRKPVAPPVPLIRPVATILPPAPVVPKVKAKGVYRGAVPINGTLRQQYQQ